MKTIVEPGVDPKSYPKLMRHTEKDVIRLYTDVFTSVVIHSTDPEYPLGLYTIHHSKKDSFEYFTGSVTLKN